MYDFNNGAVRLDCKAGVYEISRNGERIDRINLSPAQSRNPILAINQFADEIKLYLTENAKEYLCAQGYNTIMGCKNNMPCGECCKNQLNTPDSGCMFGGTQNG